MKGLNPKSDAQKRREIREKRKWGLIDEHEDFYQEIDPNSKEYIGKPTVIAECPNRPTCGFCLKYSECIDDIDVYADLGVTSVTKIAIK